MGALSDIVSVSISANTRAPTQAGFNQPLLYSYHTRWLETYRVYEETADMITDGFTASDAAYLMALALCSQDNRPESFIVGRHTGAAPAWTGELVITDATEGAVVSFRVVGTDGLDVEVSYTILAAATTTTVATAVELLVEALAGINCSSAVATISITAVTAGVIYYFVPVSGATKIKGAEYRDTTPDQNYGAAIAVLDLETGGTEADWYGVAIDLRSAANIEDTAAQIEAMAKVYIAGTLDTREAESTGVLGAALKAAGYDRTALIHSRRGHQYSDCGWLGSRLAFDPGTVTWKFAELSGVTVDVWTSTQRTNMETDNVNFYQTTGGIGITSEGVMSSGEFIDNTILIDWLTARIMERVFGTLANAKKVPFTDKGSDLIVAEVLAQLREGEDLGGLETDTSYVRAPAVSTISTADRAARHLRTIRFGARIAGAVHKVTLQGDLTI
jgi:hypothetical protein